MPERSAGILLFRGEDAETEVLLVHPGGPFWARKDDAAWSIPKGLYTDGEEPLRAARREFEEEVGAFVDGDFIALGEFRMPSGKRLSVWALEGDFDPARLKSNSFEMEWPPHSGRRAEFPEADRAGWFRRPEAMIKIVKGQAQVLEAFFAIRAG